MHKLFRYRQRPIRHREDALPLKVQSELVLAQLKKRDHNRVQVGYHRVG